MKRRPSILWIILLLTCTMCSSFPVIINLGGGPWPEKEPNRAVSVINWNDSEPRVKAKDPVWVLEEIGDTPLSELPEWYRNPATISFDKQKNRIHGNSPCNGYSAPYLFDGTQFKLGSITATMLRCKNERMFFDNLERANTCIFAKNGKLYFLIDDMEVLQFGLKEKNTAHEAQPMISSGELRDKPKLDDPSDVWLDDDVWLLEEINDVMLSDEELPQARPQLQFNANRSQLKGRSLCNPYTAPCNFYGDELSIGKIVNSWDYCDGEEAFYVALSSATACVIEEDTMYLLDGETEVLQFRRGVH